MPRKVPYKNIEIKAADIEVNGVSIASTTLNLSISERTYIYHIFGNPTLTSNITIQPSGTLEKGVEYTFKYSGSINLNGNTLTLFGRSIVQSELGEGFELRCYYDGVSWKLVVNLDSVSSEIQSSSNTGVNTGVNVIDSFVDTSVTSSFWMYYIKKGSIFRGGYVIAVWDNVANTVEHSIVETDNLGGTVDVVMSVDISSNNVRLLATASSDNWEVYCKRITL